MLKPRPYQTEALRSLDAYLRTKPGNPCVVIPTGGGKSLLIGWSIQQWRASYPQFRCIVLAHRKELVIQNHDEYLEFCQDQGGYGLCNDVGVFCAALNKRDYDAQILFASIDSVYRRAGEFAPWDAIMVDEAHRIPPSGEGKYLTFLRESQRWNKRLRVIGWTATPYRMGSGPICHKDHLLNEVCYEANVSDLITQGYLSRLRSKAGSAQPNLDGVQKRGGEYVTPSLAGAVNKRDLVSRAVAEAVKIIVAEQRRSIVFFCVDVAHCQAVSAELARHGIVAPAITAKTSPEIRDRVVRDFKNGRIHAVANVNVFTEGFNSPNVDCLVLLRPTLSPGLFSQMVGRGLRLHPGKADCLVLDFAGCIDEHGPIDLLDGGKTVCATCGECREVFSRAIRRCPQCGWEIPKREVERLEAIEAQRRMHGDKASNREILSSTPEICAVSSVKVSRHTKPFSPDSLKVCYRCGMRTFREWICLDHSGYAQRKALEWWRTRMGDVGVDKKAGRPTVNSALNCLVLESELNDWTKTITVRKNGKYYEIIDYNQTLTGEK